MPFPPGGSFGEHRPPPGGPGMPGPGFMPGPMRDGFEGDMPPWLHGLKLSEEQEDKVFALNHAAAPALHEQAKALRKAREALAQMEVSGQYDESKAKALADSSAKADSQLRLLQLKLSHDIQGVLTAEQRQQLEQRRQEHDRGFPPGKPSV